MPTLKEYSVKIAGLRSTRKMTRTMKMVSANKLRKSQELLRHAEAYRKRLCAIARQAVSAAPAVEFPLCELKQQAGRVLLLLVTSDRGLCGGFNNNLNRRVVQWIPERGLSPDQVAMSHCGRRGYLFFRTRARLEKVYQVSSGKPEFADARRIYRELEAAFLSARYDGVYIAFNAFKSSLAQQPVIERLLPVARPPEGALPGEADPMLSVCRPSAEAVAAHVLGCAGAATVFAALVASAAGEHGARMTAMDNSTTNAEGLIETYSLLRNRARQAQITRELSEIISGAEALQ